MNVSERHAHIQHISCLGLPGEVALPAMLQTLDTLVSAQNSNFAWTDRRGRLTNYYARHVDPASLDIMLHHSHLLNGPGELSFEMHSCSTLVTGNLERFRAMGNLDRTITYNEIWNTVQLGDRTFLEPLVGIARVHTSIETLSVPGATITWEDQTSLRLSLGGRIGVTADYRDLEARFSLTGRVWHETDAANRTLIDIGGSSVATLDDFGGTFSELSGAVNLDSRRVSAFSAFLSAGLKWNDDYRAIETAAGIRYRW